MTWRTARRYSRAIDPESYVPNPSIISPEPIQNPSFGYFPKSSDFSYHPPGPGIGLRRGPAPALGRPGLLPRDHGSWKNEGCFARASKGWKPDIMSIGDAHACPGDKGPQSESRPWNISGDDRGYNSKEFRNESDVANVLKYLGYRGDDGNAMIRRFQRHWNYVVSGIALVPDRYKSIQFIYIPQGNLKVDGEIGPNTLNALEIASMNQRASHHLSWAGIVEMISKAGHGYGRTHVYNAAQG